MVPSLYTQILYGSLFEGVLFCASVYVFNPEQTLQCFKKLRPHCYPAPSVTFFWWLLRALVKSKTTMTIVGETWFPYWAPWGHLPSAPSTGVVWKSEHKKQILAFSASQIWSWDKRGLHLAEGVSEDIIRKRESLRDCRPLWHLSPKCKQRAHSSLLGPCLESLLPSGRLWEATEVRHHLSLPQGEKTLWPSQPCMWLFSPVLVCTDQNFPEWPLLFPSACRRVEVLPFLLAALPSQHGEPAAPSVGRRLWSAWEFLTFSWLGRTDPTLCQKCARFLGLEGPVRWSCPSCVFVFIQEETEMGRGSVARLACSAGERGRGSLRIQVSHSSLLFTWRFSWLEKKRF